MTTDVERETKLLGRVLLEENLPDNATDHDCLLSTKAIRKETRDDSTQPRSRRHGGRDASLDQRAWATALLIVVEWGTFGTLVEVASVTLHANLGRERRDVEPEEGTADDGHASNDIDVADSHGFS